MNASIHSRIKVLIEETSDAFSSCGVVNADYAEFASLAISEFKSVLHDPSLTKIQLMEMLRTGMFKHKRRKADECWSTFMAKHMARSSNKNIKTQVHEAVA